MIKTFCVLIYPAKFPGLAYAIEASINAEVIVAYALSFISPM
jgi:hypothetical protein